MDKIKIACPRCKGCGQVNTPKRHVISDDPLMKWCGRCQRFLSRDSFYAKTCYCKPCHNNYRTAEAKGYLKKHSRVCNVCGVHFLGRKEQIYCSRKCNCHQMTLVRSFSHYEDVSASFANEMCIQAGEIHD